MPKTLFLLCTLLFYSGLAFGQKTGSLKGHLADSISKQNLSLATITIYKQSDSSIINYKLSDPSGVFNITKLSLGVESRLVISYSGYSVYRKNFTLTNDHPELDLGTIYF